MCNEMSLNQNQKIFLFNLHDLSRNDMSLTHLALSHSLNAHSFTRSIAHTAYSFARAALRGSLGHFAALILFDVH